MIARRHVLSSPLQTRARVLVPVLMGQSARPIISLGDALAASPGASGHVLALVDIRSGRDNGVFAQEQRRRDTLVWLAGQEYSNDVRHRMGLSLRMTANVASSVRDAIAEYGTTVLVLEWPTAASSRRHGLADLTRQLLPDGGTDLLFVRSSSKAQNQVIAPRSILAAIRGGASARTVAFTAGALADAFGSVLTLLHVQTGSRHPDRARREWQSFEEIVEELSRPATIVTVRRRDNVAQTILEEAAGHDLVMMGSRIDPVRPNMMIGRDLDRMMRHLEAPVVMLRVRSSARSEPARLPASNGHTI
ncbi:MAG TPA: universal stress protein [Candidatus Dormibacteraeota bacterium]|nr:universal stress protein [Candidatus Dormibacteraeota bacterium]